MQMVIKIVRNRKLAFLSFHSSTLATGFGSSFFLVKACISALSLSRSDISGLGGSTCSVSPFWWAAILSESSSSSAYTSSSLPSSSSKAPSSSSPERLLSSSSSSSFDPESPSQSSSSKSYLFLSLGCSSSESLSSILSMFAAYACCPAKLLVTPFGLRAAY